MKIYYVVIIFTYSTKRLFIFLKQISLTFGLNNFFSCNSVSVCLAEALQENRNLSGGYLVSSQVIESYSLPVTYPVV